MNITTLIDKDDPISQIVNVVRIEYSDGTSELATSFQQDFLINFLKSDEIKKIQNPSTAQISEILFNELEAYQEKHKSYLPPITIQEIQKTLYEYKRARKQIFATFKKLTEPIQKYHNDLSSIFEKSRKRHPKHWIIMDALRATHEGDSKKFIDFLFRKLQLKPDMMGYVWEVLNGLMGWYAPRYLTIKYPYGYVKKASQRLSRRAHRKEDKLKPVIEGIQDLLDKKESLPANPDGLFTEIFPIHDKVIDVSYDSLEDIGKIEFVRALEQACHQVAIIKPERLKEMAELYRVRIDGFQRKEAGKILGWSPKRVNRVWRYCSSKAPYIKKIFNS